MVMKNNKNEDEQEVKRLASPNKYEIHEDEMEHEQMKHEQQNQEQMLMFQMRQKQMQQEKIRQEQMRQEKIRQEQLKMQQMKKEQVKNDSVKTLENVDDLDKEETKPEQSKDNTISVKDSAVKNKTEDKSENAKEQSNVHSLLDGDDEITEEDRKRLARNREELNDQME
jgi:hypothetical protein